MKDKAKTNEQLCREINQRKQAEQELLEQLQFMQILIDAMPNPIFYKDTKGLFQGCNKAYEEFLGLDREKIVGKSVYDIYPKDLAEKYHEMDLALFREPGKQVYEYSFQHADNTRHDVTFNKATYSNKDNMVTGLVGVVFDVTKHKRAEEQLCLSEERFSKAFYNNPVPMAIVRFKDDKHIDVNKSYERIFGYRREEFIDHTVLDLGLYVDVKIFDNFKQLLLDQGYVNNLNALFNAKSGEVRSVLLSGEVIELNNEVCRLIVVNDITELKNMEMEISRLDRLSLIGKMAAGIGHEIRNPMTTVRGFLQLLEKKEVYLKDKMYFELMIEELDRANSIITEFLSLARNKFMDKMVQNLNKAIKALLPLIQADAINSDININVELGEVPDLPLDGKEIRQLLLNLVRNGLEAMSPGGNLTIRTFAERDKVVLAVQDEGKGIAPGILDKIGTPFFTTKDNGTGLGLATCYSIAERHNARIDIVTGEKGTTFFVRF